jgi:NADPH2:quinone reductase
MGKILPMVISIPEIMTIVEAIPPGPPENLSLSLRPTPKPQASEVLIKVTAAGINGADLREREGKYPVPESAPNIMGLEVSGTVVALGPECHRFKIGDEVCALLIGGGYAEYVVAPEGQCLSKPTGVSLVDSAGIPEVFCTAWSNVIRTCKLNRNETLLVHGGTSGLGHATIKLAKAFGAKVFATARTKEKCAAMKRFGADLAINYEEENIWDICREKTGGKGVDVIVDIIGGDYLPREVESLAFGGRLMILNLQGGAKASIDFSNVHSKHLTITGSRLRPRSISEKTAICRDLEQNVWPLFASGAIIPETFAVFPFAKASAAHSIMESSDHIGKILLIPNER